jgi:hypothetical protein
VSRATRDGAGSERRGGERESTAWQDADSDFDPDDEDMSSDSASPELTGVGLIQRELGAEIIGEFEDLDAAGGKIGHLTGRV